MSKHWSYNDYTIAWICALPMEMAAARSLLDVVHPSLPQPSTDQNYYILGEISGHSVVIACLPSGQYGTTSVKVVASGILTLFPMIRHALLVGIGAGAPSEQADIRLGDVVVGLAENGRSGILKYDLKGHGSVKIEEACNGPSKVLLDTLLSMRDDAAISDNKISEILRNASQRDPQMIDTFKFPGKDQDLLFDASCEHPEPSLDCSACQRDRLIVRPPRTSEKPYVHYGLIASSNRLIKNGLVRDRLARELNALCFEMEASGLMENLPCLVIRGICDYADSHKNKQWQKYAAATAAGYAKDLLHHIYQDEQQASRITDVDDQKELREGWVWQDSAVATSARFTKKSMTASPSNTAGMTILDKLTHSSDHYRSTLEIQKAENVLEARAQHQNRKLNWQESIVDLLKLLGLESTLQTRTTLAEMLNIHAGPPGSAKQNISLHQAVLQELARNGGDLPTQWRSRLASTDNSAISMGMSSDSDESETESTFSNETIASSQASSSLTANPALEIAYLLLKNDTINPLFGVAIEKFDISMIRKKLKGFIFDYGIGLEAEASNDRQNVAAKFMQSKAKQITMKLTRAIVSEIKYDSLSNRKNINKILEELSAHGGISTTLVQSRINQPHELLSDSDSEDSDSESKLSLQALAEVEEFFIESRAFVSFTDELRSWLGVSDQNIHDITTNEALEVRYLNSPRADDDTKTDCLNSPPPARAVQQTVDAGASEALRSNQTITQPTNSGFIPSFIHLVRSRLVSVESIFWPEIPKGFKRLTWRSPLGKLLYIDVRERVAGAAEQLQERLKESAQKSMSDSSFNTTGTFSNDEPTMAPCVPPAAHLVGIPSNPSAASCYSNDRDSLSYSSASTVLLDSNHQTDRKYLLLCFSTKKSEIFRQIDVTLFRNDQYLFENLHSIYHAIKREESWWSKLSRGRAVEFPSWITWYLGDLHLYKPKKINFVSFQLMPLGETPAPFNIRTPSFPPQHDVDMKKWDYSPCPIDIEEWAISEAFATKLLEPGHAFRNAEWLQLFPKKMHPPFVYDPGEKSVLWGINIIEGMNIATVVLLALLLMLLSALLGLIYSLVSHDVSAAFTIAAWFATSTSLFISYLQLKA